MPHFTEEQLQELETVFALKRVESLPVRDGRVTKSCDVWWRSVAGPERVRAGITVHWENIRLYPDAYQIAKPKTNIKVTYLD